MNDYVSPVLCSLHYFPIHQCVDLKIVLLIYKVFIGLVHLCNQRSQLTAPLLGYNEAFYHHSKDHLCTRQNFLPGHSEIGQGTPTGAKDHHKPHHSKPKEYFSHLAFSNISTEQHVYLRKQTNSKLTYITL